MRLAVARVVSSLPSKYLVNSVDLADTATAQLKEDKDVDARTVMSPVETQETIIEVSTASTA